MEKVRMASGEKQATRKLSNLAASAKKKGGRVAFRVAGVEVVSSRSTPRRATVVQAAAAKAPAESTPRFSADEVALRSRVNRMGLLPGPGVEIDVVINALDQAGLCHTNNERLQRLGPNESDLRHKLLVDSYQALEESPTPAGEWPGLREVCGDDLISQILSISPASLRRYASGERRCPDDVAARLHWLALVVEALEGSYNAIGIRRWFERPRQALDGATPLASLEKAWLPEQPGPQRLKALAEVALAGMVAR